LGWLVDGPVVITQSDGESSSAISAVSSCQNPIGRDETASAESGAIDKDGHLPRELMGNGLFSTNDAAGSNFGLSAESCFFFENSNSLNIRRNNVLILNCPMNE
jgi:hypothetical protein